MLNPTTIGMPTSERRARRRADGARRVIAFLLLCGLAVTALGATTAGAAERQVVTLAQWKPKDPAAEARLLARFERETGITVRQRVLPADSDVQHQQFVTWLAARDPDVDVIQIDQIWTAELASAGWLQPLDAWVTPAEQAAFIPPVLASARWRDRLWALPRFTESGLLYYRRDLLPQPPASWEELARVAAARGTAEAAGYVFQGKQYEGLVVNFTEILWGMGGALLDADGRADVASPAAARALGLLAGLTRRPPAAAPGVLTYAERESLEEFQAGRALMHRNWSFAWAQLERADSPVRGRVGAVPLPGPAALGGWHLAVSAHSRRPEAARALVRFLTSEAAQRAKAIEEGRLPTRARLYDDPEVLAANPHFGPLRDALVQARARPATPFYARLSGILQVQLSRALAGLAEPAAALAQAQRLIARLPRS
jgi:multiple sugar transport system substrate-binding protein